MTGVYSIVFLVLLFTLTTRSSAPPLKFPRPFSEDHLDTRYLQSSTPDYTTEAFECGETNYPIPSGGPKKMGDSIRICVQPNRITRERGVVMRGINNFTFNSAEITQKAVLNGGLEGGNTIISCVAGEDLCVFRTILDDFHFFEDGTVTGTGEIFLEYVTAEVARQTNPGWQQNLRRAQWTSDILFAGTWLVELTFEVEKGDLDLPEGKETFSDWWGGKSLLARNAFFAISTLFLICIASCIGYCCCRMIKYEMDEEKFVDGEFPRDIDVNSKASFFDYFQKDFESTAEERSYVSSEEESSEEGSYASFEEEDKFDDELFVDSEIEKGNGPPRAIGVKKPKRTKRTPAPPQQQQPPQRANAVPIGRPNPDRKPITPKKPQSERSEYGESSSSEQNPSNDSLAQQSQETPTESMSSEPSSKGSKVSRSSPKKVARKVPPPKRVARNVVVEEESSESSEERSIAGESVDDIPVKASPKKVVRKVPPSPPKKTSRQVVEVLDEYSDENSAAGESVDDIPMTQSPKKIVIRVSPPPPPPPKKASREVVEVLDEYSDESSAAGESVDDVPMKPSPKKVVGKAPPTPPPPPPPKKASRQVVEVWDIYSDEESPEKGSLVEGQPKNPALKGMSRHSTREEGEVLYEDSSSSESSSSYVSEELFDEIPKIPIQRRALREVVEVIEDSSGDSSLDNIPVKQASVAGESVGYIPIKQSPKKVLGRKVQPKRPARQVVEVLDDESSATGESVDDIPMKQSPKKVVRKVPPSPPKKTSRQVVEVLDEYSDESSAAGESVDDIPMKQSPKKVVRKVPPPPPPPPPPKKTSREVVEVLGEYSNESSAAGESVDDIPMKQSPSKKVVRKAPPTPTTKTKASRQVVEVWDVYSDEQSPEKESLAEEQPKKPVFKKRVSRHAARQEVEVLYEDSSSESSLSSSAIQKRVSREVVEVIEDSSEDSSLDVMPVKQAPPKKKSKYFLSPERRIRRMRAPTKKVVEVLEDSSVESALVDECS